jgi:PilZ domain
VNPDIERRQHSRSPRIVEVRCEAGEHNELFLSRDISAGGVFLKTPDPLPANSEIVLTFRLSPGGPMVTCAARVVYAVLGVGMGIQFYDARGELELALEAAGKDVH